MKSLGRPRQPFVGLALAAVIGIVVADHVVIAPALLLPITVMTAACGFILLRWPALLPTYLLSASAFFLLHSFIITDSAGLRLAQRLGERPRVVSATGLVISEPKIAPSGFANFLLKLSSIEIEGNNQPTTATISVRWKGQPKFGDELKLLDGIAEPIGPPRNPGEFDLRSYLARQDVRRSLFVRDEEQGTIVRRTAANIVLRAAQKSRDWMQRTLSLGLESEPHICNVIQGVALGIHHETANDIEQLFQHTGTFHLFAVSGLNVAIVAQLLFVVGVLARLPRLVTVALIIPALGFYAVVTGLQTSCIRAAVMGAVLLAGFFVERRVFSSNSLAAAAFLILAWNTNQFFSIGFQLSFAVVFAILLLAEPIFQFLRRYGAPDPFLPRLLLSRPRRWLDTGLGWVCGGASVSLAAWVGSLPLIYWNFHLITPISLFANLMVVPIAFCVLAIAMVTLICAPLLSWLTIVFNHANWFLARLLLSIVNVFAQVPGGHFYLEQPHLSRSNTEVTVLDVGTGSAVHLRTNGANWLFDCGPQRDYEDVLREYLHARGVNRLEGVLLTHGDSRHIGAAQAVIDTFLPKLIVDNPIPDRSRLHRRIRSALAQRPTKPKEAAAPNQIDLSSGVTARIVFPPPGFTATKGDDQALVVQLLVPPANTRVLLMSDSGELTEKHLLQAQIDLRSEILVKGQHQSGISGSEVFLNAVQPKLIIATSRDFPKRERIDDQWAERVRARGTRLFRQDETGAVEMKFDLNGWEARAYATGETFRSSSR